MPLNKLHSSGTRELCDPCSPLGHKLSTHCNREELMNLCWICFCDFNPHFAAFFIVSSVQFSSIQLLSRVLLFAPGFPIHHHFPEFAQIVSIKSVMPSNHLILCHPLLLLPSIFPSIRVFSNELVLCLRWPKYWSFSSGISPSNESSGLICYCRHT